MSPTEPVLGGISAEFAARATRKLLPYKNLPKMKRAAKKDTRMESLHIVMDNVPPEGNQKQEIANWTDWERKQVDGALRPWARWKVDYVNQFVQSPQCEGSTRNLSGICDRCQDLSKDPAFRNAVNRVSVLY